MFHKKSRSCDLHCGGTLTLVHVLESTDADGVKIKHSIRCNCSEDLQPKIPPVENFKLKVLLDAGVDLQPVNTKVLSPNEALVSAAATEVINRLKEAEVSQLNDDQL